MKVFKIPESLANQYHGAGWALAAVCGGELVALRYVADVAPDSVAEAVSEGGTHAGFFVRQWLLTTEAAPVVSACRSCNHRKADRFPHEAGMALLYAPYVPSLYENFILSSRHIRADVMEWLLARVPKGSRLI